MSNYAGFPANSNYRGYYFRIKKGNSWVEFNNPAPKREGLVILPHLVQTADSGVLASGKLSIKVLKHARTKIQAQFPVMTMAQYKTYYGAIMQTTASGKPKMNLTVEYYNEGIDDYETGVFYHNDMQYKPAKWEGREMIDMQEIHLIEH